MTSITGGCLCGRVRYTIAAAPLRSGICHCRSCQRSTGSAFQPSMIVAADSFRTRGEVKTFDMAGGSGQVIHRRFCPNCGTGVFNEAEAVAGAVVVLAGTLDDPGAFAPEMEIFCDSALPWVKINGETQRLARGRSG